MRFHPFPLTDMPWPLMAALVAVGLPRTVLADLDIVAPESGLLYYVLALVPFAAWLAVAIVRDTRRPVRDFLVLGVLYGLSLILAHQLLWNAPGAAHSIPQGAVDFASGFEPGAQQFFLRGYTALIGLGIGIGTGLVAAVLAFIAHRVRIVRRLGRQS
ncbi:hypothetical protein D477_008613 [Arthrobacter crystallopoietes BAB-32]|uniref:Uncharacterized protein n=2 Tax=Crystallibacter crystallopoietes TaxID=37928 RepID=N1UZX7_9MICC|nr:hypothetical protein D477_008613 [Arthrobacter crystallopoietes BAB-32]